jgi:hypothetical protein
MQMKPATYRDLGPRGPIFARRAGDETQMMQSEKPQRMASLMRELRDDKTVAVATTQVVPGKRYDLPSVEQQLRQKRGLTANPVRAMKKQEIVALNSIPLDRLGAPAKPLPSIGQQLAGLETELAGTLALLRRGAAQAARPQPLAQREAQVRENQHLQQVVNTLERQVLTLRQQVRSQPVRRERGVRAVAISAQSAQPIPQAQPVQPISGLGEGFMDIIKKPIVWGPIAAFAGVFLLRTLIKKRRAAASAPAA